jgi:hypothetical protein
MKNFPSHSRCATGAALSTILLLLWAGGLGAQETQFFLRNGDRLTGTVLAEDPLRITLTNATIGKVFLAVSQVERRAAVAVASPVSSTNQSPAATTPAAPVLGAALLRRQDELTAAYVSGRITAAEFHRQRLQLLAEVEAASRPAGPLGAGAKPTVLVSTLTGEAQAGLDLGFATKDRQLYAGRLKLNHSYGRLRNAADYLFTYGRTDGDLSANRMEGRLKTDFDLSRHTYAYNLGVAGYDSIRKLDDYFQIGPGVGRRLLALTNLTFNLEGGANFQRQIQSGGAETDIFYYRLAQEAKLTLGSKLSFDEKIEYLPQWDDFREYKLRVEANVKYWLNTRLFVNLSMIDLYDTMPAPKVQPNDLQIRSTIGLKF